MANSTAAELHERAQRAAGNWMAFPSFAWHRAGDLPRPQDWTIVYTRHRDADALEESNAAAIDRELAPFLEGEDPDVLAEHHRHWASGYVEGYAIRVWRDGEITPAFCKWCAIEDRLVEDPVLDEEDYFRRCREDALEGIRRLGWPLLDDDKHVPETWAEEVYGWLWKDRPEVLEDYAAGYRFQEEDLRDALKALGYLPAESPSG